jgi:two-component system, OmpR family, response regulator CpxR
VCKPCFYEALRSGPASPCYSLAVHILLVDDDAELCTLLSEFLRREGFQVDCEHEGNAGLARALTGGFDLVALDVMLPGLDGFEILRRLRQQSKVPVIMLTARGEDVDRIVGLELGADDYLPKPFNPRELAARIRAILRRYAQGQEQRPPAGRMEVNGIQLDPGTRQVFSGGKPVEVTTFEFDILEMLMRSAGRVLSRDALMENFYNRKATPFDRSIDMHISHLRKKLEHGTTLIKTIRGVGYQFCRTPEDAQPE